MVVTNRFFLGSSFVDLQRLYRTMRADTDHGAYYSAALVEQQVRIVVNCMYDILNIVIDWQIYLPITFCMFQLVMH